VRVDRVFRRRRSTWGALAAALIATPLAHVSAGHAATAPTPSALSARAQALVPRGDLLVETGIGLSRRLRVLDRAGHPVRRSAPVIRRGMWSAIELARDRRHAFVSSCRPCFALGPASDEAEPAVLYELNLADGHKRFIAHAVSPALSPDHTRLAYLALRPIPEMYEQTALVVRDLRTGAQRSIPFVPTVSIGAPPELIVNWSPDGRLIALVDKAETVALVEPNTAISIGAQPALAGEAPVFLDSNTLIVLANCCTGRQRLVAVDTRSGARSPFAQVSSVPVYMRRIGEGRLLVVTILGELVVVSKRRSRVIATDVYTAAL
jgi:hypothetical protein